MVRVYWTNTEKLDMEAAYASCSEERRRKADTLKQSADCRRSIAAAAMLDEALKPLGLREKYVRYVMSESGKPAIEGLPNVHFSLSHSGSIAVCAIADRPVGVDVERRRDISKALLRRYFTETERAAADPIQLWTLKEAYCKMTGAGLSGLADTRLVFDASVFVQGTPAVFWECELPGGYRLALCCAGYDPVEVALYEKTGAS